MTKSYRVSGFLFHAPSQQILLHQPNQVGGQSAIWAMISGEAAGKDPSVSFRSLIGRTVKDVKVLTDICQVYNYFHRALKKTHYVCYALVDKPGEYQSRRGGTLAWFTFKQVTKLPLSAQTKHDIIIAQRVVQAQARERGEGEA